MDNNLVMSEDNLTTYENSDYGDNNEGKIVIESSLLEENMGQLELGDVKVDRTVVLQFKGEDDLSVAVDSPRPSTSNRRYSLRPQKRPESTDCDEYAVNPAKKRRVSLAKNGFLETIFENPIHKNGSMTLLGKAKLRRSISFNAFVTKAKIRHRKIKIKRLSKVKVKKSGKVTLEDVRLKLECLEDSNNEGDWMDITK